MLMFGLHDGFVIQPDEIVTVIEKKFGHVLEWDVALERSIVFDEHEEGSTDHL
jgi:hypothetical protein